MRSGSSSSCSSGEAKDGEAELTQVEVAGVVVLEGDRAAVVEEGVDFDDEALRAPEEVDLPAAELDVGLGEGEAVATDEGEEVFLEVTARAVGPRRRGGGRSSSSAWRLARRKRWGGTVPSRSSIVRWMVVTGMLWR